MLRGKKKPKLIRVEIKGENLVRWKRVKRKAKLENWPSVARQLADHWLSTHDPSWVPMRDR